MCDTDREPTSIRHCRQKRGTPSVASILRSNNRLVSVIKVMGVNAIIAKNLEDAAASGRHASPQPDPMRLLP